MSGSVSVTTTVRSSGASTVSIDANRSAWLAPSARWASSDQTTSADVNGAPLWNVTPSGMVNVYVSPSSEISGSSVSPASMSPSGVAMSRVS